MFIILEDVCFRMLILLLLPSRFSRVRLCATPWSVRPHGLQPTRLLRPWNSPGKNTGVGCHFLLQCMKVERPRVSFLLPPGISFRSVAFLSYILNLQTSYILQITEASSKEYSQQHMMCPIPFGVGRPVVTTQGGQPYKKGRLGNAGPDRYKIFKTL